MKSKLIRHLALTLGSISVLLLVMFGSAEGRGEETAASIRPNADEALRQKIQESFRVNYLLRDINDTTLVQFMIQVDKPPANMAFDAALRSGGVVWPLGPMAWMANDIKWWAYDVDLPEDIGEVDVVLTPSASAATRAKHLAAPWLDPLTEVWSGPVIVLAGQHVGSQEHAMCKLKLPTMEGRRERALEQFEQNDPVVQQLKSDGDWARARAQLSQQAQEHPGNAAMLYNLGCARVADEDLDGAMKLFIAVRQLNPPAQLGRETQHELRFICARYLHDADTNADAMYALGTAYEHGRGVKQLSQEAKRWYRKAANAGQAEAMRALAAMYENETGATIHTEKAHEWYRRESLEWYRRAATLGNEEAKQWLATHK